NPYDHFDQSPVPEGRRLHVSLQRAIELAKVVDDDCRGIGMPRFPSGARSLHDDRRIPLYWFYVLDPEERRDAVLTYDCQHFYEGNCESHPSSVRVIPELLVNAHDHYDGILSDGFDSCEHLGVPPLRKG
ncbi:MAG: hypothetical protein ACKPKO_49170, partial [Candidatus Fonsibacter sp.]